MDMDMDMDVNMDMDMDIDVYHRPNLELACNVGSRLFKVKQLIKNIYIVNMTELNIVTYYKVQGQQHRLLRLKA